MPDIALLPPWTVLAEALVLGYLLGSIPFGLIFTRLAGAGDIREIGSGNIGATNVLRTGSRWAAAATLLCDAGKAAAAVFIAEKLLAHGSEVFAALGAILGHLFPVWLGFKGGKGVAVFLGSMFSLFWPVGLAVAGTWLAVAAIWRISSLSALVAVALAPVYFYLLHQPLYGALAIVMALIIFAMHRDNIRRLIRGEEPRIGTKAKAQDAATP